MYYYSFSGEIDRYIVVRRNDDMIVVSEYFFLFCNSPQNQSSLSSITKAKRGA